jgi:YesN/AraC family two-component response regulator
MGQKAMTPDPADEEELKAVLEKFNSSRERAKRKARRKREAERAKRRREPWSPTKQTPEDWEALRAKGEQLQKNAIAAVAARQEDRKLMSQIIDSGFKALAIKFHPDKGGSTDMMTRLNKMRDRLKRISK